MGLFSITRKKVAVVSTVAVLGIGGGIAYAYWSSSGTGAGSATTGTAASALKFTDTTAITDMAPGVAAEPISGSVKNINAAGGQNAFVNTVTVSIDSVTEAAGAATGYTCSAADYTLGGTTVMPVGADLTPGSSAPFSGATIAFHDLGTSVDQDACQGATVNLKYTSN